MLSLNDITFNKWLGKLISRSFEMPYVSYCHPLAPRAFSSLLRSLTGSQIFKLALPRNHEKGLNESALLQPIAYPLST